MCRLHGRAEPRQRDALQQPLSLAGGLTSAGMSLGIEWFLARLKLPR
jgi:hypothetical protein